MANSVTHTRWDDLPREAVTDTISRKVLSGDKMMIAQVFLEKDAVVPQHHHENEQITYIVEGALKFWIGEDGSEEVIVRSGEVLQIPSQRAA